ncbi:MAG: hypothetical protein HY347_03675 [candidate division NC10 bacterium]|nr:hypothetical protein [candidate division NC10 bacterium]
MMIGIHLLRGILVGAAVIVLAFFLRTRSLTSGGSQGGDAWYYLLYVEELKRSRRIPVTLPYFLLDIEEQWYPPGFPVLLSLFPEALLKRYRWAIAPAIDCLQLLVLSLFTLLATKSVTAAALAGVVYATTPTLIAENLNLNSRSFGSLLFTMTMLFLLALELSRSFLGYLPIAAFGGLLLLTHKLSSQGLLFILLGEALWIRQGEPLLALGAALGMAFLLSTGFFLKLLKGHLEILRFWRRNLLNLGAHQVYDSSLYRNRADSGDNPSRRFHRPGLQGFIWHLKVLLSHNLYILALPLLLGQAGSPVQHFCTRWLLLIYLFTLITTFLPPLRFLGEGLKYLKLAAFPLAFLLGAGGWGATSFLLIPLLALNLFVILRTIRPLTIGKVDDGLLKIVQYLKQAEPGGVMTIPTHVADPIAYLAKRKVLWGAHSSGYDKLEPFFPVLKQPFQAFFKAHGLTFLLIDQGYVDPKALDLRSFALLLKEGSYQLYRYHGA